MESKKVSNNMLDRMPIYLNYIKALPKSTKYISATKIAGALGFGEVSVRKDLAKVCDGGRCKLGYPCDELIEDIEIFLGMKSSISAIVAGKGEMLQFLLSYDGMDASGVKIVAGFDVNCSKKRIVEDKMIYPIHKIEDFCKDHPVQIGVLMVPMEQAQLVCNQMIAAGVEAIWNFTPMHLEVPDHVVVQNESFIASVTKIRMQMKEKSEAV